MDAEGWRGERSSTLWIQIAAGVCIGTLAASALTWLAVEARLRWEVQQMSATVAAQRERQAAVELAARQRAAADVAARTRAQAEAQRASAAAQREVQVQSERRAAAWRAFYKPSPNCVGSTATVECANEFMRAKRRFESEYGTGR